MDINILGRLFIGLGIGITVLGLVLVGISRIPFLKNFGHLPGDIRIQTESFSCFAPIVSMLILSIVASVILNIIARILTR